MGDSDIRMSCCPRRMPKSHKRILFIPDTHVPFHNKTAFNLVMRMAKKVKFDRVVILGDFADFYEVSFHAKTLIRRPGFVSEVKSVNGCLDQIDKLGIKEKDYVAGNHEYRLDRYLAQKAPEIADLPGHSVPDLFRLKERGWGFTPYQKALRVGKLWITHDEGTSGPLACIRARSTFEGNVVIGHCHAMTVAYQGNARGETHVGASFGWLGNAASVDYMHQVKARKWVTGVGVGLMEPNGVVHLQPVPIIKNKMVVFGQLYT